MQASLLWRQELEPTDRDFLPVQVSGQYRCCVLMIKSTNLPTYISALPSVFPMFPNLLYGLKIQ